MKEIKFNPQQAEAISHRQGPMIVLLVSSFMNLRAAFEIASTYNMIWVIFRKSGYINL